MKHFTVQKGCQALECKNGGFCDGHDPASPVCYCLKGFTGRHCELGDSIIYFSTNVTKLFSTYSYLCYAYYNAYFETSFLDVRKCACCLLLFQVKL
jgi:hypothetical protein